MHTNRTSLLNSISIRARLLLLAVCSVGVALFVTCFALLAYNYYSLRGSTVEQLQSQAQMLAFNSSGVLAFQDAESAQQLLDSLRMFPSVDCAFLVDQDGAVLATYPPGRQDAYLAYANTLDHQATVAHEFTADHRLVIRQRVIENQDAIGQLTLLANLDSFDQQLRVYVLIVSSVMLLSFALASFLSLRLQRFISTPIARLVAAAKTVTENRDYSTRVGYHSEDELGRLCATFDRMLEEIQGSKDELQSAHDELEVRVEERTSQLTEEIQQRKEVLVELETARDAAEAASKAKSEFLANMSHEIRTPLNGVLGFADLLAKQVERGDANLCRDYLDTIQSSGKHLLVLINDILDISKIEAGQLEVESVPCSPHEVIAQVTSVLRAQAQTKGLDLQYRWASQVPDSIQTDPARLRQLLMNLVGNAVKFTEAGFVTLTARLDLAAEELVVSVEDSGVGISEEKQRSIFDPFVQADNSVTRRFGGTGLGLAISRRLARAMGGDLEVSSQEGAGSCFTARVATGDLAGIVLRSSVVVDALRPELISAEKVETEATQLTGARILVVEDGVTNRKLLEVILQEAGALVTLADNGQVGYEVGREGDFDAILMDMQMPVMDGYTAARKLREAGVQIPIIGLTAHAMTGDREKCLAAGCCGYLTKPIDAPKLLYYLASRLGTLPTAAATKVMADVRDSAEARDRVEIQDGAENLDSQRDASHPPAGDDAGEVLRSMLPVDEPIYAEIVVEFAEYALQLLIDMENHLNSGDYEQLAKLAHSLKGSGGSAGFPDFTKPAQRLEQEAKDTQQVSCQESLKEIRGLVTRIEIPSLPEQPITIEGTS